jgi:hypothetical protein
LFLLASVILIYFCFLLFLSCFLSFQPLFAEMPVSEESLGAAHAAGVKAAVRAFEQDAGISGGGGGDDGTDAVQATSDEIASTSLDSDMW